MVDSKNNSLKNVEEINEKIRRGEAVVYTAEELKQVLREGKRITPGDVDVVTTGTCGIMSGTAAILSIPVAERRRFGKADKLFLNDVMAFPGPCPNESLGIVDAVVYGTSYANNEYGGGHLFRDMAEGKKIGVRVEADNKIFEKEVTMSDMGFARMVTTRTSCKNYVGFLNSEKHEFKSIFSVTGLKGPYKELSVSGCGEINPLENDPLFGIIGVGTKILVNGAVGYVMGEGTRSNREKPNLSVYADMKRMEARYMGGFKTSKGPECITSIAVPLPVTEKTISDLCIMDEGIKLPIAEIHDRVPFAYDNYASIWQGTDSEIHFNSEKCIDCDLCDIEKYCPTKAFSKSEGIEKNRCFNCGTCIYLCPEHAFEGEMGSVEVSGKKIPITLRQSNRAAANELCEKLKKLILEGEFYLSCSF
ncbi:MAG: methanogenesis marker 16 metalloprotein [Candidatus Methanofastidiosia archaeon]